MRMFSKHKGRLKALVFGTPSSGKTTLFTGLWQCSDQENFLDTVNGTFRSMRDGLINGHSTENTKLNQVFEWQFILAHEPRLAIELKDYAGEHAREFLQSESGKVKGMLTESDGVLLLLDSFQICKAESFNVWADEVKLHTLLRWINEICGDSHRNGLPFIIVCTRSDLVPPDRLNSVIKSIRQYTDAHKVKPDIRSISVFDRHKAMEDVPPPDANVPPPEFLVPAKEIKSDRVEELFRDLYKIHKQRIRPDVLKWVLAILGGALLVLIIVDHIIPPKTLTIEAVTDKIVQLSDSVNSTEVKNAFPGVNFTGHDAFPLQAVYEHFSEQSRRRPEDQKVLDDAYADVLKRMLETELKKLSRFDVQDERWIPQEVTSFLEAYQQFFSGRGDLPLEAVYTRKQALLDDALANVDGANINHLAALARAYGNIGQLLPRRLVNEIRKVGGRDYVVRRIAERLQSAKDYHSLYFCQQEGIPSIRQDMRAYWEHLNDDFKREFDALIDYLELVRSTREIIISNLRFYRDNNPVNTVNVKIHLITGYDPSSEGKWHIPWRIGGASITISAEAREMWRRRRKLTWNSRDINDYSTGFRNTGMVLPRLDFLVFLDAAEHGRQFGSETLQLRYGQFEPNALLNVPRLLIEANQSQDMR